MTPILRTGKKGLSRGAVSSAVEIGFTRLPRKREAALPQPGAVVGQLAAGPNWLNSDGERELSRAIRVGPMRSGAVVGFLLFAVLLSPSPAFPEMYKWVDKNGKSHFTDDVGKIPVEHRSQIKAFKDSRQITEPPPSATISGDAATDKGATGKGGADESRFKSDNAQLQQILDNPKTDVAEKMMDAQKFLAKTTEDYAVQAKEYAAQGNDYIDKAKAASADPALDNKARTAKAGELNDKGKALLEKSKLFLDKSKELSASFQERMIGMAKEQQKAVAEQLKNREKEMADQMKKMEKY